MSNAGKLLDPADKSGQLSLACRALQKHGSREGSAFPSVKGSPSEINAQGQKIADEILSNPATTVTYKDTGRFGKDMDVIAPDCPRWPWDSLRFEWKIYWFIGAAEAMNLLSTVITSPQTERIVYSKFGRGRVSWPRYHMSQEDQLKSREKGTDLFNLTWKINLSPFQSH